MTLTKWNLFATCAAGLVAAALGKTADLNATPPDTANTFAAKIKPILAKNCYGCHAAAATSGLRLDSYAGLMKGGNSGRAIVPGDPDKSLLIVAVRQTDPDLKMPKGGKLQPEEVAALEAWVKAGAAGPSESTSSAAAAVAPASDKGDFFETRVRPIFANNCYACHTSAAMSGACEWIRCRRC